MEILRIQREVFAVSTVRVNAENLQVLAYIEAADLAGIALAAVQLRFHRDLVSDLIVNDIAAGLLNYCGKLMPHHHRHGGILVQTVINLHVAGAHTESLNLQKHLILGDLRNRSFLHLHLIRCHKSCKFHSIILFSCP